MVPLVTQPTCVPSLETGSAGAGDAAPRERRPGCDHARQVGDERVVAGEDAPVGVVLAAQRARGRRSRP